MIHTERWYREAVRPIRIDPEEIDRVTDQIFEEIGETMEVYFSHPGKPIPPDKYLWAPNWGPRIKVKNVKGEEISIPITVLPTQAGPDAQVGGALTLQTPKVLMLKLPFGGLPAGFVKDFLRDHQAELRRDFRYVILHELTHAKDIIPQITYDSSEVQQDPVKYYNDPAEVRAYMHEMAEEVWQAYPQGAPLNSETLWKLLETNRIWRQVEPYLEPESRRKMLQGVVQYLNDRMPQE